jgi:formiminotetrahydrofolate cyclodeaminase
MNADKDYLSLPISTFLDDLASKAPTPGGGSVACLSGAVAAAQAAMVIEYTVGKPRFAEHEDTLKHALAEFERARALFSELMREDMAAYQRWVDARKSDDPVEKQRAAATAAAVPMEVAALGGVMLALLEEIKNRVNPYLVSDLKVAADLTLATVRSAGYNVTVNLPGLEDEDQARKLAESLQQISDRADAHRDAIVQFQP